MTSRKQETHIAGGIAIGIVVLVLIFSVILNLPTILDKVSGLTQQQDASTEISEDTAITNTVDPEETNSGTTEASADVFQEWSEELAPNYYLVIGKAETDPSIQEGSIEVCDLDVLGRSLCAVASLTQEMRTNAGERDNISSLSPSGWTKNFKTEIPSANGGNNYSGWFWNRSHLLADSLGGPAIVENLVTGTRTQNVGNRDNQGGMAYTEEIARQYLDSSKSENCPLFYSSYANYLDEELIPRSVTVNIKSCDGSIDQQVLVFNAAKGYSIDYYTGETTTN